MPQEEFSTLIASGLAPGHRCGLGTDRKHLWLQLPPGDCHSGAQAVVRWHVPSRACEEGASRCTTPVGFGGWQKDFWGACEAVEGEANILVAFSRYPVIAIF